MSIVLVWDEFLSVSWISPQHHGSFMAADWCWEHPQRKFRYGGVETQSQCTSSPWLLLFMKLMIKTLFQIQCSVRFPNIPICCCSQRQTPPFPHRPPTLAVILVLSELRVGTQSPSYLGMSSSSFTWLFCFTFFGKAQFLSVSGLSTS